MAIVRVFGRKVKGTEEIRRRASGVGVGFRLRATDLTRGLADFSPRSFET